MNEIMTSNGKRIQIISPQELRDPISHGDYVRAYCHIHGSDHQRSLSINRANGWGHCFNAVCEATVLVAEWNPTVTRRLLYVHERGDSSAQRSGEHAHEKPAQRAVQPVLLLPTSSTPPAWQQEERRALLNLDEPMRAALAQSGRARAYLHERGISLSLAQASGVGYLPAELLRLPEVRRQRVLLQRWTGRLLFPLHTPDGQGYIGRSLWGWVPGMDEHAHKALLDRPRVPRRWIKTNPAGWFGYDPECHSRSLIVVEGAFDRLALLSAGLRPAEVVALAGTAMRPDWVPAHVIAVILALDADAGGEHATARLVEQLEQAGIHVEICPPPRDRWGIDWSERWRKLEQASMKPLYEARAELASMMWSERKGA